MSNFPLNTEQLQAKEAISCNVAVSAGAGSGKTRVLVERFLHILEQYGPNGAMRSQAGVSASEGEESLASATQTVDAGNILAITYTRKAAAEMKARVRQAIEERLDTDVQGYWHRQLEALNRAQISTIHGLCNRILSENPVEAQLDPSFTVAEEFDGKEFLEECLKDYLQQELKQQNKDVAKLLEAYGVSGLRRQVETILPALGAIATEADLTQPYAKSIAQLPELKDRLCIAVRDMVLSRQNMPNKKSKTYGALEQIAEYIEQLCDGIKREPADFTLLDQALGTFRATGNLKDFKELIQQLKKQIICVAADKAGMELVPCWQGLLQGLDAFTQARKRERDFLTYDDLESFTLELLMQNETVRKKYQERYRYIMVDEFQDTNDRQRQLVYLLCGDSAEQLQGQKLFVVGDPKQSIYRFRGADVSVFASVRKEIAASGGLNLQLKKNYRSATTVLDAVNGAFRLLMGTDSTKDVFFEELEVHKPSSEMPQLYLVEYDKECGKTKFQVEAEQVARVMQAYHEARALDGKQLLAPKIPYGDMAILLRAMTHTNELETALQERGIPYEVVDGKGFYERQEVLDLLNLLTALNNRYRSIELAGVLRSPYFGLDDESLTRLFLLEKGCLWDNLQTIATNNDLLTTFSKEQQTLISRAAQKLALLRMEASLLALPELWQLLWRELSVDAVLSLQEHGPNKLANAQKLGSLAQDYCVHQGGTLSQWLEYVRRLRAAEARETAANLGSTDAVKIMTIHKSKGLEFSTVFLPFLHGKASSDTDTIKYMPKVGLGITAPDDNGVLQPTSILAKAKEADKLLEQEERKRLLYVAMTRAEDRLLMSGILEGSGLSADKRLEELSWFRQLQQIYGNNTVADLHVITAQEQSENGLVPSTLSKKAEDEKLEHIGPLAVYEDSGIKHFSPSSLQTYLHCQRQYYYQYVLGLPPLEEDESESVNGSENAGELSDSEGAEHLAASDTQAQAAKLAPHVLGGIVHRTLELYKGDLNKALARAMQEYAPLAVDREARAMLEQYIASDLYQSIPTEQLRELPFTYKHEYEGREFTFSGIIDCLGFVDASANSAQGANAGAVPADANKSLAIIDYKTGRAPEAGELKAGYAYQLAIYKEAVEQRFAGLKVSRAELHYLRSLTPVALPLAQAGAASTKDYLQEACKLCAEICSKKDAEEKFVCTLASCEYCPYNYVCNAYEGDKKE